MPSTTAHKALEAAARVLEAVHGDDEARETTIDDAVAMAEALAADGTFVVLIELGDEAMSSPAHVAEALRDVATNIDLDRFDGPVRDANGNTVGFWKGNG